MDIKKEILEKEHDLIADISTSVWDSINKEDREEDSLTLAYISGVTELASAIFKVLDSPISGESNELSDR